VRVASDTKEEDHSDHVVRRRRNPKALVSRAGSMARQVMGSSGGSTIMDSPLSDMARMGLVAVLLLISGIGARSMFEEAVVEGGRVTCHARKSALDEERATSVESWYQRHVSTISGIDVGTGLFGVADRGVGHMWAPRVGTDGIVAIRHPVWFRESEIGFVCVSG